jgi:hypothetical protein
MGYEDSKIYRLVCDDGCYYYGSTITTLRERLWHHKESAKTMTSRVYSHIRTIGWDKVKIELVEAVSCANRKDLRIRENGYIEKARADPACLNTLRAYTSDEEKAEMEKTRQAKNAEHRKEVARTYYHEHKDTINQRQQQYYKDNKETFSQKSREYNATHRSEIQEQRKRYYEENKERLCAEKREWRAQNPELFKQKSKEYREKNAEKIREAKRRRYAAKKSAEVTDSPI